MQGEEQILHKTIILNWSEWISWHMLPLNGQSDRGNLGIPLKPGVYEVRRMNSESRLTIGESLNLYTRLRKDLVRGKHSAGERFREMEDTNNIEVKWARTDKHKEAEAALKGLYVIKFGTLPEFTKQ